MSGGTWAYPSLTYDGEEHNGSEYFLVLMNAMCDHDDLFIDTFMEWVRRSLCRDVWEMSLSELWYEFVNEYAKEHDQELLELFEDEIEIKERDEE